MLLLLPTGSAQQGGETVITSIHVTIEKGWDPEEVIARVDPGVASTDPTDPGDPADPENCSGGEIRAHPLGFEFQEIPDNGTTAEVGQFTGMVATSCAVAHYAIPWPAQATNVDVQFLTDRQLSPYGAISGNVPTNVRQEFGTAAAADSTRCDCDRKVFAEDAPPSEAPEFRNYTLSRHADSHFLTWRFADEGQDEVPGAANPTSTRSFSAEVSALSFRFASFTINATQPLQMDDVSDPEQGLRTETFLVDFDVDPSWLAGHDVALRLILSSAANQELQRLTGPGGEDIAAHGIPGSGRALVFNATAFDQGPGTYSATFKRETTFVVPPPPPPATLPWLYPALVVLPAIGAVFSGRGIALYHRSASGRYLAVVRYLWVGLALFVLYYAFQVIYTLVVIGWRGMTTLPLTGQVTTFYVQILFLAILLGIFAFIVQRRMRQNMEQEVAERAETALQLSRSNQELEHFAYVASHDLQEPLRKVASYTMLLKRRYGDQLDEEGHEFIEYAVDGAKRMQSLVAGLLQYSRVQRGDLEAQEVDLATIMHHVLADLGQAIEEAEAKVLVADMPKVRGEPVLLRLMLQNLVSNGIKFRENDRKPIVKVRATLEEDRWHIEVADNGIGVPEGQEDRLFQVFQRAHHRSEYPGMGLGLALVQRIAFRHGGETWYTSRRGKGSTFHVTLATGL